MNISKTQNDGKTVFSLSGRLDTTTAPELQAVLIPEFDSAKEVELDFKDLVYLSSAGLRVLIMGEKTAKAKKAEMCISHVSPDIMEIFDMTGFTSILNII